MINWGCLWLVCSPKKIIGLQNFEHVSDCSVLRTQVFSGSERVGETNQFSSHLACRSQTGFLHHALGIQGRVKNNLIPADQKLQLTGFQLTYLHCVLFLQRRSHILWNTVHLWRMEHYFSSSCHFNVGLFHKTKSPKLFELDTIKKQKWTYHLQKYFKITYADVTPAVYKC